MTITSAGFERKQAYWFFHELLVLLVVCVMACVCVCVCVCLCQRVTPSDCIVNLSLIDFTWYN
jgi:hypothetical protein